MSPGTNHVDDEEQDTFILGRPMDDNPEVESCKHCKKNVLKSGAKAHIAQCLRVKKEKAQRKKEAREARERAREAAREEEARKAGEDGEKDDDSDDDEGDKGGKGAKTSRDAGKGKKRKADGEAEKGPYKKKKKDDAKPKAAKPKGEFPRASFPSLGGFGLRAAHRPRPRRERITWLLTPCKDLSMSSANVACY